MAFLQRFGLSIASVVFLVIGVVCALSALLTGLVYRQDTWEYWQAVHTWRIEWLLAAVVAMLAAILLKKQAT
jgi:branched-subunit amino acid transport protein